jgi:hypothetical protein
MHLAGPQHSSKYLFHPLNAASIIKAVRAMGASIGHNPISYNTRSLRKGGGTSLCSGGRLPAYLIKKQLRWKSDVYEDVYQSVTEYSLWTLAGQLAAFPSFGF